MNKLFYFPSPAEVGNVLTLTPDDTQQPILAVVDTHPTGRVGVSFTIPSDVPNSHGAALKAPGWVPEQIRGILILNGVDSFLRVDDVHYQKKGGTLPRLVVNGQFLAQDVP